MRDEHLQQMKEACARRPHGTRSRYVAGCRCMLCRAANSRYSCVREQERLNGDERHWVTTDRVCRHIAKLRRLGVGIRAIADASDTPRSVVNGWVNGSRRHLRRDKEARVLALDASAVSDGAIVDAAPAWRRINELLEEGYSKAQLARWLGCKTPAIQFNRHAMLAASILRVERLYQMVKAGKLRRDR